MFNVMERRDARSLDHATLEEMRRLAVKRVEAGEKQVDVARSLGVHAVTVCGWVARYRRKGADGLAARKAPGAKPKLSEAQQRRLLKMIVGKEPRQLELPYALWTVRVVGELIVRRFGIVLHETSIARMLRRMGLTPQRPARRAFFRDEDECRRWATEDFPGIVRAAKRRQSTLLFEDETGVHEDGPVDRSWGLRGQTPIVQVTGRRNRANVISAISPRGRLWLRCFKGTLTAARVVEFLEALLSDVRGKIELVLDRHPAHVASATRRFIEAKKSRIRVHYLPTYAPELNPDEHVWAHLKGMFRREPIALSENLGEAVERTMENIRADRATVRRFFDHPEVAYVKDALAW
jgi:transposase